MFLKCPSAYKTMGFFSAHIFLCLTTQSYNYEIPSQIFFLVAGFQTEHITTLVECKIIKPNWKQYRTISVSLLIGWSLDGHWMEVIK